MAVRATTEAAEHEPRRQAQREDARAAGGAHAVDPRAARRLPARTLARLQRRAGNAAVVALLAERRAGEAPVAPLAAVAAPAPEQVPAIQRQAATCPPPPVAPPGTSPEEDPKFKAVESKVKGGAAAVKKHPTASAEARKAQAAAVPPANDRAAQAKAAQTDKMSAAKPGGFDKKAFVEAVRKAIEAASPKNLDEADKFSSSGKAAAVKGQVMGQVTEGKRGSEKDIKETTAATPDSSVAKEKPVTPLAEDKTPPKPTDPDAAKGMPGPAPAAQTNLGHDRCETDTKMREAGVTEQQLKKSNEPEFQGALEAKKAGEEHSEKAPAQVREQEKQVLDKTSADAHGSAKAAIAGMVQAKVGGKAHVAGQKAEAKAKDEGERQRIAKEIEEIYARAKTETEAILTGLDAKVTAKFEAGEKDARAAFEASHKRDMDAWKEKRYAGFSGKIQWGIDLFKDLPPEVNVFYDRARKLYLQKMEGVISDVADLIGTELTRAKDRIAQGRNEIKAYVAKQPASLQKFATEAQQKISAKFDALDQDVDAKQNDLVQDLANKYVEARNAVDERIKELQAENKGLWSKAKEAVGGVIETILKLKDMLLGVLAKAAGVVDKIISAPIEFLGNLVNAVKSGLQRFVGNIAEHLKGALQQWLFGALAGAGLELPAKFDLKGILHLIMQLLGLTWASIRARIVKALGPVGEKIMGALEKAVEVVQILIKEGPAGLWKFVVEKITDLKDQVIGKIKEFVITKIVIAGITWLVSLLNPASAFIKACKAIVDIVRFFIDRGSEIMEFVNTVLDSMGAIASGAIGGAASAIEGVLKRILPLVLGFLASLLGLGGISEKIKSVIEAVQKPVGQVIDAIIGKVVKFGKKLWGKLKAKFSKKKEPEKGKPDERTEAQKKAAVEGAVKDSEALMDKQGSTPESVKAGLPAIKERHQLTVLQLVTEGPNYRIHAELNPRGDTKTKAEGKTWKLAPGGFRAQEALGRDDQGNPLTGGPEEIRAHLMARHVDIDPAQVAARVNFDRQVASAFLSYGVMEKAVMDCLHQRATEINDKLTPGGKPAAEGTTAVVVQSLSYRCGYGYSYRQRQSRANKPRPREHFRVLDVAMNDLRSVTVVVRVSNAEKHEFVVHTAWPTARGG
jgi:Bacterial CdiA-CT RNAse A domain